MRVKLHICCHTQGTITGLRYVKSCPRKIQYIYISWYSGFNIQLNVSPLILVICRQFNERYTPHFLPNTGNDIRFTLCHLYSRPNPIQLHFSIFRLQYSIERIFFDTGDMSIIQCALCSTFIVKYTAQYQVDVMPTLALTKSNRMTFLDIQASIFNWTYLPWNWLFIDKSMHVILHLCCQI
jgi:hypothetical protein